MNNIEFINEQYKVTLSVSKVLLMCDDAHYYSSPRIIEPGVTYAGRPVQLFDTIELAWQHISDNNLVKYEPPVGKIL